MLIHATNVNSFSVATNVSATLGVGAGIYNADLNANSVLTDIGDVQFQSTTSLVGASDATATTNALANHRRPDGYIRQRHLTSGASNDTLTGGGGNTSLTGGAGADLLGSMP